MLDKDGFRSNVAIIISNGRGKVLLAKRLGQRSWQFPQGGLDTGESVEQALYRELYEEIGLQQDDVEIIQQSKRWLRYRIPKNMQRKRSLPLCIGQKQRWFFLRLISEQKKINLNITDSPEFDAWEWVNYWYPISAVVSFKRNVYRQALLEFSSANTKFERSK